MKECERRRINDPEWLDLINAINGYIPCKNKGNDCHDDDVKRVCHKSVGGLV